jgi:intein/homing endonuclease
VTYDIVVGRSKHDKDRFGLRGTIFLGKHYVTMGQTVALSNKVYLDMVRSHVVFVCGKRGGGKCVVGDTRVTLNDGSRIPIRELKTTDKQIVALNGDLKLQSSEKENFYERTVDQVLRITLRSGKQLTLTPEHPLLLIDGWHEAREIVTGSRIATPRILPFFGEQALPEYEIKLLAYLIAEGHLGNKMVGFSNTDPLLLADFTHAVGAFDQTLVVRRLAPGSYAVRVQGYALRRGVTNPLKDYLKKLSLYERRSHDKFVPQIIFTATRSNTALFLNRLLSCDGTIYYDKNKASWRISYASKSRQLIDDVQSLLLKFGILSRIRRKIARLNGKSFSSYELEIGAAHIPTFLQEIGFFGKKLDRLKRALRDMPSSRNPNVDTIPKELWEHYRPDNWAAIGRSMGYAHPKAMRERLHYAPSRQTLAQIAIADHREDLLRLAHSDIFWDEIVRVEDIKGSFPVYDITVPGLHNFVANDIIIHNSYTMGVIAEGMADLEPAIKQNLSIILLDTMGIYWTMKYPNVKEKELLGAWAMQPKPLPVTIFTPQGFYQHALDDGIPTDAPFAIRPDELLGNDWVTTFSLEPTSPAAVLIERVIHDLAERGPFGLDDVLRAVEADREMDAVTRAAVRNRFVQARDWGVFSENATPLSQLARPGQVTVLDLSAYATAENGWAIKALVVGIVSQKLFLDRMVARKEEEFRQVDRDVNYLSSEDDLAQQLPLVWLVIDEAHEFLPNQGKTLASDPLITILREGRQPGISLILASQQPGKIHTDVMTQSDIIISHRITAKLDTDALGTLMQSYLRVGLDRLLDGLPRTSGAALILDDNNEKMFPIQVRPRITWHGGESPSALKEEKELFDF